MLAGNIQEWLTTPTPPASALATIDARTPHDYWLVFNECEHQYQCNTPPIQAAGYFASQLLPYILQADPNAKLIIGGVNAHECGIDWLKRFVEELDPAELAWISGWHFHLYPEVVPADWVEKGLDGCDSDWIYHDPRVATVEDAWNAWQTDVWNIYWFVEQYGDLVEDEIWITEMGCSNPGYHQLQQPVCQSEGYMYEYVTRMTGWLNSSAGRWIDRYAWYTDWNNVPYWNHTKLYAMTLTPTMVVVTPGTPTLTPTPTRTPGPTPTMVISALGHYYTQITPAAAGELDDLMPHKLFLPAVFR
jgi:hypothetical protein